jgi:hypothetical protein
VEQLVPLTHLKKDSKLAKLWSEMIQIQTQELLGTQIQQSQQLEQQTQRQRQQQEAQRQQVDQLLAVLRCLSLHLQLLHHLQQLLRQLLTSMHKVLKVQHPLKLKQAMLEEPWQEAQQL